MSQRIKSITSLILCVILVSSLFSCKKKRELQVHFYEDSIVATAENKNLVIGTKKPEIEGDIIDTLVITEYNSNTLAEAEQLLSEYEVETVYIPDEDELYELCSGYDVFTVVVEGSMSFGIGAASVTVSAGEKDTSLITRIKMGKNRVLICGSMDKDRLEELKKIDEEGFRYINLTAKQKDIAEEILSIYKPKSLIFTGVDPYIDGYEIVKGSILLKE